MVFHNERLKNEKLVLKRSILGLGRVMYLDVARMLEQIKRERGRDRETETGGGGEIILYYTSIKLKHKLALLQLCP